MGKVGETLLQKLLFRIAEGFAQGVVDPDGVSVEADEGHTGRSVLEGAPETLLALLQSLFDLSAFGGVPGGNHNPADSRVVERVYRHAFEVAPGTIRVAYPEFRGHSLFRPGGREQGFHVLPRPFEVVGVYVVVDRFTEQFFGTVAEHVFYGRAEVVYATLGVHYQDEVRDVLDQRVGQSLGLLTLGNVPGVDGPAPRR